MEQLGVIDAYRVPVCGVVFKKKIQLKESLGKEVVKKDDQVAKVKKEKRAKKDLIVSG